MSHIHIVYITVYTHYYKHLLCSLTYWQGWENQLILLTGQVKLTYIIQVKLKATDLFLY